MPKNGKARIFISYARSDGGDLAGRLKRSLEADGFRVWLDTGNLAGGAAWSDEIEQAIDEADTVLAIISRASRDSQFCKNEQLRAVRKGKTIIPLLAHYDAEIPLHLESKHLRNFAAGDAYKSEFRQLANDIRSGAKTAAALAGRAARSSYVTVPPLPRNYIEFPEALSRLQAAVLRKEAAPGIPVTALRGMGGVGKTVLAQALCRKDSVRRAFRDDVVWTTAGKEPPTDVMVRMREVRRGLGDEPRSDEAAGEGINRYRTVLRNKAALIIVDDVWRIADIEPYLADSRGSRLLFTTRDASIAAAVGALEVSAEPPADDQSLALLARWSGSRIEELPEGAAEIVRECGRLPLALSMIGALLRGKPAVFWQHTLAKLRESRLPEVFRPIHASLAALEPADRERYIALAVLLDDMTASVPLLRALWNATEASVLETVARYLDLSLAKPVGDSGAIAIHELQLDFARSQSKLGEDVRLVHDAIRLSAHFLSDDQEQFASQLVGRLLIYADRQGIGELLGNLTQGAPRPWLRPYRATLLPPGTSLGRTLEGNSGEVRSVAVSADWRLAVSAHENKTVRVWDLESGQTRRVLTGHSEPVNGVAVTPDARIAVSASLDRTLKVWNLKTGKLLHTLKGHRAPVWSVAVSADGQRAISGSDDGTMRVWNLEKGRELRVFTVKCRPGALHPRKMYARSGEDPVMCVALSEDTRQAIAGCADGTLRVFDLESGRELFALGGGGDIVNCLAVSSDWRRAISGSEEGPARVWDLVARTEMFELSAGSEVLGCGISANGRIAVGACKDNMLKVWDLESAQEITTLEGHSSWIWGVFLSRDGKRCISACKDSTLKLWNLEAGTQLRYVPHPHGEVTGVAVSARAHRAVTSHAKGSYLEVWDVKTTMQLSSLKGHHHVITGVGVRQDGLEAISGCWDKTVKVWNLETFCELQTLKGKAAGYGGPLSNEGYPPVFVSHMAASSDGKFALAASADGSLTLWDLSQGREVSTITVEAITSVALSDGGRQAVFSTRGQFGSAGQLEIWDLHAGRKLHSLKGHTKAVRGVAVSADGTRVVSASEDATVRIWDSRSGLELCTFEGHRGKVWGAAASADGTLALSVSEDKTLRVWNVHTHDCIVFSFDAPMRCCAYQEDGYIIAGDQRGFIHFLALER